MRYKVMGDGLVFCNKKLAMGEFSCELPTLLQCCLQDCNGGCYIYENVGCRCENAVVIFFQETAFVWFYFREFWRNFQMQFLAQTSHLVKNCENGVTIESDNACYFCDNKTLENCDCIISQGCDWLVLKFEKHIAVMMFEAERYCCKMVLPASEYIIDRDKNEISIKYNIKTSGKVSLFARHSLAQIKAFQNIEGDIFSMQSFRGGYQNMQIKEKNNFSKNTFGVYFFELVFSAKLCKSEVGMEILSEYLCESLKGAVLGIMEYLGDFCGILPCEDESVCLVYEKSNGCYIAEKFVLEVEKGIDGRFFICNIIKQDNASPPNFACDDVRDILFFA